MPVDLRGKVALVTGGSGGIGAAIARRLAQAGARVTISFAHDADGAKRLVEALIAEGLVGVARHANPDDPEAAAACVAALALEEGRLDILVNNAAIGAPAALRYITAHDAERQVRVNLIAPLMAIRAAALHLAKTRGWPCCAKPAGDSHR